MPFVTKRGGERLNWDIRRPKYDPKTGELEDEGNAHLIKDLELTGGVSFDYQPYGKLREEILWRGEPDPEKMCWNQLPVYRVLTNRFVSGFTKPKDKEERNATDWGRFMREFEKEIELRLPTKTFFYEPHLDDIRKVDDNPYYFPLWVIEQLLEWGQYEKALKTNKVDLPHQPRLTKIEYERIMKAIEERKALENGELSKSTKSSEKPSRAN